MLTGIKLKSNPNNHQKAILSQWMGCARYIWNAKCNQEKEQRQQLKEQNTYPKIDQTYTHLKDKEETPWLFECPSVILRNSISNWYKTYQNYFKKLCGRPKYKKKDGKGSIHLTRELFEFIKGKDGVNRLFIGSKTNNIGFLSIKNHRIYKYKSINSIYIRKKHERYSVSFCYEEEKNKKRILTEKEHLKDLRKKSKSYLEKHTIGIDRGVCRPLQSSDTENYYDLNRNEKHNKVLLEKQIRRYQKKLSRQQKGSKRRLKTKIRLSNSHSRIGNIRENFCHQTSRKLVNKIKVKVIIFEDLGTKRMTKKPKVKKDSRGRYLRNNARAKAGLNKSILDKNWHLLELFTKYKSKKAGKVVFKVGSHYTSQECSNCSYIHPGNRKSQEKFVCLSCGHTDNADVNASKIIKQRGIKLILNSGTELSKTGLLSCSDSGRGDNIRRKKLSSDLCSVEEASKKKMALAIGSSSALA